MQAAVRVSLGCPAGRLPQQPAGPGTPGAPSACTPDSQLPVWRDKTLSCWALCEACRRCEQHGSETHTALGHFFGPGCRPAHTQKETQIAGSSTATHAPDSAARLAGRQNTQTETHARCSALCQTALHSLPPLGSSELATRYNTTQHRTALNAVDGVGLRHRCPGSEWCALPECVLVAEACCVLLLLLLHAHQQR